MKNQDYHPSHKTNCGFLVTFTEVSVVEVIGAGAPANNPEEVKLCLSSMKVPMAPHSTYVSKDSTLSLCAQRFSVSVVCDYGKLNSCFSLLKVFGCGFQLACDAGPFTMRLSNHEFCNFHFRCRPG